MITKMQVTDKTVPCAPGPRHTNIITENSSSSSDVSCLLVTFPFGVSGQVWYLIVSIPDLIYATGKGSTAYEKARTVC